MCKKTGKDLHRASLNTKSWRIKRKLLAKSNWMKHSWRKRRLQKQNPVILKAEEEARENDNNPKPMKRRKLEVNISSCAKKEDKKEELNKLPEEITVLFIPTTPDEKLTKMLMKEEEKIRILMPGKTRFIERAGNKILHQLTMTKPWDKKTCSRRSCLTCAGDDKGKCRSTNILYQTLAWYVRTMVRRPFILESQVDLIMRGRRNISMIGELQTKVAI